MSDFALRVIADTAVYQAKFAEVPGFTDRMAAQAGKKLVDQMTKAEFAAAAAAKRAAGEAAAAWSKATSAPRGGLTGDAKAGLFSLQQQLMDIAQGLATGQSPFTIIAQQSGQVVTAVGQIGSPMAALRAGVASLGALGPVVAGLAVAAGGAAIAYKAWNEDSVRAAEVAQIVRAAHVALEPTLRATEAATVDLREAMGWLTAEEADLARNGVAAFGQVATSIQPLRDQVNALRADQQTLFRQWVTFGTDLPILGAVIDAVTTSTGEQQASINALNREIGENIAANKSLRETKDILISKAEMDREAEEAAAEAKRQHAKAARELEERLRALSEVMSRENKIATDNADAYRSGVEGINAVEDAAKRATMTSRERALAEARASMETIEAHRREAEAASALGANDETIAQETADAKRAVWEQYGADLAKFREDEEREAEEASRKAIERAKREADKIAKEQERLQGVMFRSATTGLDSLSSVADGAYAAHVDYADRLSDDLDRNSDRMSASQRVHLRRRIEAERSAAREAFGVAQGLALASAIVNTASGVAAAIDDAPWPANLVPIGAAALAGGAEIATIASTTPSFARGGFDGIPAELHPREAVLNPQGRRSVGDQAILDHNASVTPRTRRERPMVVLAKQNHRTFSDFIGKDWKRRGKFRSLVEEDRIPGHRRNRR